MSDADAATNVTATNATATTTMTVTNATVGPDLVEDMGDVIMLYCLRTKTAYGPALVQVLAPLMISSAGGSGGGAIGKALASSCFYALCR
jgi:hypothetical protein